jgi:alcohol dehydrogenase class IV
MGLGNRENVADIAIVDPQMAAAMPRQVTADTGLDALTHAIEGYTCTWQNDLTDGLCLDAARLIFEYLPRACDDGADMEARERMHNAATGAGLGFGNAMASLAHAMGHTLGAVFHIPHGRAVSIFLPYTIEFAAQETPQRFAELAVLTNCSKKEGQEGANALARRVRELCRQVGNPTTIAETGIQRDAYMVQLEKMVDDAFNDTQMITAVRASSYDELLQLFLCAYDGRALDALASAKVQPVDPLFIEEAEDEWLYGHSTVR